MNTMFHPQLPVLILLYLFFILNHSILCFSAGTFPTPNSPYDSNLPNYDYPNSMLLAQKQRKLGIGRVNTVATVITILLTLLNIIVYKLRKLQESNFYEQLNVPLGDNCRRFLLDDILLATNHFDDDLVIGHGGFGKVYKGVIDKGTLTVAIKRLNRTSHQGAPEFWTEVEMLSKFRHSHLVSLIGYCNNCNEMILVYEYMIHGTVADHLHKIGRNGNNNSSLSWVQRLKICIGAARGLEYLHTGTGIQHRVIHRDVKSSNILLDENWAAKISDFGLSKTGPADQSCTHISTNVKGTFGYLDPEYFLTHRLTRKSDVYAFGVVLFEVLSGRRAVDVRLEEEQWGLAGWAQQCFKEGRLHHIIDPNLKWEIFPNSLNSFAQIANQCLDYHSKNRPTMAEVVAALESALALQHKRDSSMIEMEIFDICGTSENQEKAEQQEVIGAGNGVHEEEKIVENLDSHRGQQEVINVGNEDKQIDKIMELGEAKSRSSPVKPARITAFTRMVRQLFHGTFQVTLVHSTAKPPKNGKSSINNGENSNLLNKDGDVQQLPLSLEMETPNLKIFTYAELETATGNFEPRLLIGEGTFGRVFRGWVDKKTYSPSKVGEGTFGRVFRGWVDKKTYSPSKVGVGMAVAVKKFDLKGFEEYVTWQSEVELLGKLSHPNIVNVLGYCLEKEKFLVVYEYMERGSLQRHLFSSDGEPLSWGTRLNIAIGAARGFAFLHSTEKRDVYRQFKSHNILLDSNFTAKLSDIQLAEISYSFNDYYFPGCPRTLVKKYDYYTGAPPEFLVTGHLNKRGHVYCFGVVLLEILTGAPVNVVTKRSGNRSLGDCARMLLSEKRKVRKLIDRRLRGTYLIKDVFRYAELTLKCLDPVPMNRPLMDDILKYLEHINEKFVGTKGRA